MLRVYKSYKVINQMKGDRMQNFNKKILILGLCVAITACSTQQTPSNVTGPTQNASNTIANPANAGPVATDTPAGLNTAPVSNQAIGGSIELSMDAVDKKKMFKALDKSLGKATEWTNEMTGIHYTVVPIKKVTINENRFCRSYHVTGTKSDKMREVSGIACVGEDGDWHSVS